MAKKFQRIVSPSRAEELAQLVKSAEPESRPRSAGLLEQLRMVSPDLIDPNPFQPRKLWSDDQLNELIDSVRLYGFLQAVVGRPNANGRYTLISGHRRLEAARRLGLEAVPLLPRDADETDLRTLALVENIQREDLHPIDKARALVELADGMERQEDAARLVNMNRTTFHHWLCVRDIRREAADLLMTVPDLSLRTMMKIAGMPGPLQIATAKRLATTDAVGNPENGNRKRPVSNLKKIELRSATGKFSFSVHIKANTRKHSLTNAEYRQLLLEALAALDVESGRDTENVHA